MKMKNEVNFIPKMDNKLKILLMSEVMNSLTQRNELEISFSYDIKSSYDISCFSYSLKE